MPFIITIDGPAGSGKSTAARKLAARLGIAYLDTGAMYRAITLAIIESGVNPGDLQALSALLHKTDLKLNCGPTHVRVSLNGRDVTEAVRQPEVTSRASQVAQIPLVRERLITMQREMAEKLGQLVSEGRDQGLTVFPDAACKFVLTASPEKRAERRYHEMAADGQEQPLEWVLANLRTRDGNDSHRWAGLTQDPAAHLLDTTHLTIPEVVERMAEIVAVRMKPVPPPKE